MSNIMEALREGARAAEIRKFGDAIVDAVIMRKETTAEVLMEQIKVYLHE